MVVPDEPPPTLTGTTLGSVVESQAANSRVAPIQSACLINMGPRPSREAAMNELWCQVSTQVELRGQAPEIVGSVESSSQSTCTPENSPWISTEWLAERLGRPGLWVVPPLDD